MRPSLLSPISEHHCPNWICPACGSASLAIQAGTFHYSQTAESRRRWNENDAELDDIRYVFSCLLICERARCSEVVAASGTGYVFEIPSEAQEDGAEPYIDQFQVTSFTPPVPVFPLPPDCPANVVQPLMLSFSLFLSAPGAAANVIRTALEALLTALDVEETGSLHQRLTRLPERFNEYRTALMAIKFLGNVGSHESDRVKYHDIESAYQIIEFVLNKIYAGSTEPIARLVARMTEVFGPVPR